MLTLAATVRVCAGYGHSDLLARIGSSSAPADGCTECELNTQATLALAVNAVAFLLTNSCTLSGRGPVSVSTSSDVRS